MYKIQIGYEDGLYVAYLVYHSELLTKAEIKKEITNEYYDDLIDEIPEHWKDLLTSYMLN